MEGEGTLDNKLYKGRHFLWFLFTVVFQVQWLTELVFNSVLNDLMKEIEGRTKPRER